MPLNDVALVVGIDAYIDYPLTSCVNDARCMAELLGRNDDGSVNYTVTCYTAPEKAPPTRDEFLAMLHDALDAAREHDFVLYYSGHGAAHAWGTELVVNDEGRVGMEEILTLIHRSQARQVVVILDACFSGAFGEIAALGGRAYFEPGPSVLAASRSFVSALAGNDLSAFTELIAAGMAGGAADHNGDVTALALFGYASAAFGPREQRPAFKANMAVSQPLRRCHSSVPLEVLRSVAQHFPAGSDALQLAPGDVVARGAAASGPAQERFVQLLQLREAGLVKCDDDRHLSDHAAASGRVMLTPAGQRIRTLAVRDLI
jgi:hypothetical protein